MTKTETRMTVTEKQQLQEGIWSLSLQYPENAIREVVPGQFVGICPADPSALLPRPISVCRWFPEKQELRLVFRTAGKGTAEFAAAEAGDSFSVLCMLGNGYDLQALNGRNVLLLGGGIGIPPLLELAVQLRQIRENTKSGGSVTAVLGYRNADLFLKEEFEQAADRVLIAAEDGSTGVKGTVLDAVRADREAAAAEAAAACGPMPMLRAVKAFAEERGLPCYISLEERMACGVGACLGCVAKTVHKDAHSQVNNARVCTEGPVFMASEVDLG